MEGINKIPIEGYTHVYTRTWKDTSGNKHTEYFIGAVRETLEELNKDVLFREYSTDLHEHLGVAKITINNPIKGEK